MAIEADEHFYDRADAHIRLANGQTEDVVRGKVSASFLYGAARFNVYVAACKCDSKDVLVEGREDIRDYYVAQYTKMLEEHLDDYIEQFDRYMAK